MKNIRVFHLKIFSFLEMKFSIYLNRRVFVMVAHSDAPVTQSGDLEVVGLTPAELPTFFLGY